MNNINVFIGFDSLQSVGFSVLAHSIYKRASRPVTVTPLMLSQLQTVHTRVRDPKQSTDFSFTRFLVPYLSGFEGWSLFMDCDMLCLADIAELWDLRDEQKAVMVVKHDYSPRANSRFWGTIHESYPKKNWSSVMLFNNARCRQLTPAYVNTASGLELHQFKWVDSEESVGELPLGWNFLAGEYHEEAVSAKSLLHYTLGSPYMEGFEKEPFAEFWFAELREMLQAEGRTVLP